MSKRIDDKQLTIPDIIAKKGIEPIVMLTSYSASFTKILDKHVDMLLVGDSLGMVIYGMESTLGVTLNMMIAHGKAVAGAARHACVIVDMPFASYQGSKEQAFRSCAKVMQKTGCAGVKLEGGRELSDTIEFLTQRGIPVMAHVGLMPQKVKEYGGYRYQGRNEYERGKIIADARNVADAGAFAVLIECVDKNLATKITKMLSVPVIGIGAGAGCDGQVLVTEDMAGLFEHTAKFVKRYGNMRNLLEDAVGSYADEVRNGVYPSDEYSFG